MIDNSREYIICAAIHFDDGAPYIHQPKNIKQGFVVCGRRHHNIFYTVATLAKDLKKRLTYDRQIQGFLTNKDRFLTREEAALVAFEAGQTKELETKLISEDLY